MYLIGNYSLTKIYSGQAKEGCMPDNNCLQWLSLLLFSKFKKKLFPDCGLFFD